MHESIADHTFTTGSMTFPIAYADMNAVFQSLHGEPIDILSHPSQDLYPKFRYQAALFVLALCTFVIVVVIVLLILYIFLHINVSMIVFDLLVTLFHHLHSGLNVTWQSMIPNIKDQVQWPINIYGLDMIKSNTGMFDYPADSQHGMSF